MNMSRLLTLILVQLIFSSVCDGNYLILNHTNTAEQRLQMVVDIVNNNWKDNGWTNLFAAGNFSSDFFSHLHLNSFTVTVTDFLKNHHNVKRTVPHHSNTIIINCLDFDQFERAMTRTVKLTYWHPLSNVILYYHSLEKKEVLAKMFFIFWYYRAINAIIIQYDDAKELLLISQFNPYTCDKVKIQNRYGCWTAKKLSLPIESFEKSFICELGCANVPLESKRRFNNLGTCLGFDTYEIPYNNNAMTRNLKLFQDKGKNLQGCALRAFAVEVLPFLEIREHENNSFTLHARDGILWNTVSNLMNFKIDLSVAKDMIKVPFNFEANIQQVFAFVQRKVDLVLYPLYQFDLVIAEIDNTVAYKESGVCFISERAEFETIVFDAKLIQNNVHNIIRFNICFFCIWMTFLIFNTEQFGRFSFDQVGKDLMNTYRTVLSISINNPPKRQSFRIFLTIAIWGFFVINFSTQAAITSVFSAYKRGKEVDTMEDVLEKGYPIEGIASPDMVLPEDEEKFRMINARRVSNQDMFGCVNAMSNDSHRFCLNDCAVARYLERNRLNSKGHQFLHVATQHRLHSHYLNMVFHRHSTMTATYNKIVLTLVEAGLIKKWEEYRFNAIKVDAPLKALTLDDMIGIFKCYGLLVATSSLILLVEIGIVFCFWLKNHGSVVFWVWMERFVKKIRIQRRRHQNLIDTSTQTV